MQVPQAWYHDPPPAIKPCILRALSSAASGIFEAACSSGACSASSRLSVVAHAAPTGVHDPRADLFDGVDGATCKYFNQGALLPWRHPLGDWLDAGAKPQGTRPFAAATIAPDDGGRVVEWDVTSLVRNWVAGTAPASGIVLAAVAPATAVDFDSRESASEPRRPRLVVKFEDGGPPVTVVPAADTWLNCSTVRSLGSRHTLHVDATDHSALQFDVAQFGHRAVARATLQLTTVGSRRSAAAVGAFQLDPPKLASGPGSHRGLADAFPRDQGIGAHPDVWMAADFETTAWPSAWSYVSPASHVERVARDDALRFAPLSGYALRVTVAKGDNFGLDMGFDFAKKLGYEPEDVYFRYYLRFADDWIPTVDGGKLPGLSGTYGKAGWGGRRASGDTGWSMRGQFNRAPSPANPLHGYTTVGTYAYHADMDDQFGDHWYWVNDGIGVLERNRWYCLEQHFKVNTRGRKGWHPAGLGRWRACVREVRHQRSYGARYPDPARVDERVSWWHGAGRPATCTSTSTMWSLPASPSDAERASCRTVSWPIRRSRHVRCTTRSVSRHLRFQLRPHAGEIRCGGKHIRLGKTRLHGRSDDAKQWPVSSTA